MPSLQHAVVSRLVGRLRPSPSLDDLEALRDRLVAANRAGHEGPPRGVRTGREETIGNEHGFSVVSLWRPDRDPDDGGAGGAAAPRRALVYLHGGSFVKPSDDRHWRFATRLADALGARAVLPLYPLAPEFTVHDSLGDLADVFEEVAAECPDGVMLAGDSAGGGLALALAQELRDRGRVRPCAQPARLVLIAPWVDLTGTTPGTWEAAQDDPWLSYPHLAVYAAFWAGSGNADRLADPRVSPLHGDLTGLPPCLMLCGTRDLLRPGCDALFDRADEAGWDLEYAVAPGLVHVYPLLPIPEARTAVESIVEFLRLR
jgi:monoterpene epsilon-lactone hydrolase